MKNNGIMKKDLMEAFQFRHATKEFDPERKISDADFHLIMEAARLSPSSIGLEPWRFLVVQNKELREEIRNVSWGAQGQLPTASHFVVILARTMKDLRFDSEYVDNHLKNVRGIPEEIAQNVKARLESFEESDFRLLESDRAIFDWASKQTYIALANMMSTAALMGIDSCPIEGFDRNKVNKIFEKHGLLENGHLEVSVMAAFGFRVRDPRPKSRQPLEQIFKWID